MARPPTGQVVERKGKGGTTYGLRFRAYGQRRYVTAEATDRQGAETELQNVLADVRRGIWQPPTVAVVEAPTEMPTFHAFASEWLEARGPELKPRTVEKLRWALSGHLLAFFKAHRLDAITMAEVDRYRACKVREREHAEPDERSLSNRSINQTIAVLAQVLDAAIESGWVTVANPARGRRRRLRTEKPRRTWLELDELRALLGASGDYRPLIATMALGGLRVGEATSLCWGQVDLANGRLHVLDAKTDAGRRTVDLSPDLREELSSHKAGKRTGTAAGDLVFTTRNGTPRDRHNVRSRVLATSIRRANKNLAAAGKPPIQDGVTNHTLRRTFASLLYEAGASPAYVMGQMGHTSASMALEVYARLMGRDRDTGARLDALVRGVEWAPMGTNGSDGEDDDPRAEMYVEAETA